MSRHAVRAPRPRRATQESSGPRAKRRFGLELLEVRALLSLGHGDDHTHVDIVPPADLHAALDIHSASETAGIEFDATAAALATADAALAHNPRVIAENVIVGQTGFLPTQTARGELLDTPPAEPEGDHDHSSEHDSSHRLETLPIDGPAIDSPVAPRAGRGTPRTIDPADPLPPISAESDSDSGEPSTDPSDPGSGGGPETDFVLFRNAQLPDTGATFQASDTGEPSIGTYRNTVFQTGNWYASVSGDNGASYRHVDPRTTFPAAPANFAGGFCCDQRVAQDPSRGLTIWYLQYLRTAMNTTGTNGVRIAWSNGVENLLDNSWTYADFTPATFGLPAQDRWMDFPNLEVTNNFLYATSNVFNIAGTNQGSVMWRIPLAEMAAGGGINFTFWNTTGTIALANGATTTMFGGSTTGTNSVQLYRQNESDGNLSSVNIGGLFSSYTGTHTTQSPDGNNWVGFADERMQTMWVSGNEVGMMWNSAQGGNRPQPFVRTVRINHTNNGVINEPDIWDPNFAIHYPDMAVNARGHVSGVMWDGNATFAPGLIAALDDDLNGDPFTTGWETWDIFRGTNAGAGRWGDYTGAARDDVFGNTWLGGGYVLQGAANPGTDNDNNDVRAVWYGRSRDNPQILPAYSDIGDTIGTHGILLNGVGTFTTYNSLWTPTANRMDVDMLSVIGFAGSTLTASTFLPTSGSTDMDTMLRVFDDQGNEVAFDDDAGPGLYSSLTYTFANSGFYYIGVSGYNNRNYSAFTANSGVPGRTGDYGLTATLTPPPDVGDSIGTSVFAYAIPYVQPFSYIDTVGNGPYGGFDVDMFSGQAARGDSLYFFTETLDFTDTYLRMFDASGNQIAADDDSGSGLYSNLFITAPYTGTFYVGISGWPNVSYNPFVANSGPAPAQTPGLFNFTFYNDAIADVGDTLFDAWPTGLSGVGNYFAPSNPIGNYPYVQRDVDIYAFSGVAGQVVTIGTDYPGGASMDTILRLFDASGNQLTFDDDAGPGVYSLINGVTLPYTGTYYVGVSGFANFNYNPLLALSGTTGSVGDYSISITISPDIIAPFVNSYMFLNNPDTFIVYLLPTGNGEQLRTPNISGIRQFVVIVSEDLVIDAADVTLSGAQHGSIPIQSVIYDPAINRLEVTFVSALLADEYTLSLNADGSNPVTDASGNRFDGEWDNPTDLLDPTSSVVSGNGVAGGNFNFRFNILPGDANRDNMVTGADFTIWADNFGAGPGATLAQGDFNGDGFVTGADFTIWNDLFGSDLTGADEQPDAVTIPRVEAPLLANVRRAQRLDERAEPIALITGSQPGRIANRATRAAAVDEALIEWDRFLPKWESALAP